MKSFFCASALLALVNLSSAESYYENLGVDPKASTRQIRVAFKKLVIDAHPEANSWSPFSHSSTTDLIKAYTVLSDHELRRSYDAFGEDAVANSANSQMKSLQYYKHIMGMYDEAFQIELLDYHAWEASHYSTDGWFIQFYSSEGCPKCEDLKDAWLEVGNRLIDEMHVAVVDCDTQWPVCRSAGVWALPSIVLYERGTIRSAQAPQTYKGASKDADSLVAFAMQSVQKLQVSTLDQSQFPDGSHLPMAGKGGMQWILGYCGDEDSCTELNTKMQELSFIVDQLLPIAQVDCKESASLCAQENIDNLGVPAYIVLQDHADSTKFALTEETRIIAHTALKLLAPLPTISVADLSSVASLMLQPSDIERVSEASVPNGVTEYLVLFVSQDKCDWSTPELGIGSALCYTSAVALRKVMKALDGDAGFTDLEVRTFDCHFDEQERLRDVKRVCEGLRVGHGLPEILLLRDGAMRPQTYHDELDQPEQLGAFLTESYGSNIHEISEDDFQTHVVNEKQTWFVDFYAPWCHHCRDVYPEWKLASRHYDLPMTVKVHFAKINCNVHADTCAEHHVQGYPTFLLFHEGVRHQFDYDHRTAEEFVRFIKEVLEPSVLELEEASYKQFVYDPDTQRMPAVRDPWVLNFFAPWCSHCHTMAPKYEEAAKSLRGVMKFAKMNCELDEAFCSKLKVHAYPTIWRFNGENTNRDKPAAQYTGQQNAKNILEFAMEDVEDYVEQLDSAALKEVLKGEDREESWVVLYYTEKDCPMCEEIQLRIQALASRYYEKEVTQEAALEATGQVLEAEGSPRSGVDPVASTREIELKFAKINCRQSGLEYTTCLAQRVKKFPTLLYYSGANKMLSTPIPSFELLEIISVIDAKVDADRRTFTDPFKNNKRRFTLHDEL